MINYFIGVKFKGELGRAGVEHLKDYYDLDRVDLCRINKTERLFTCFVREYSMLDAISSAKNVVGGLIYEFGLTVSDLEVSKL